MRKRLSLGARRCIACKVKRSKARKSLERLFSFSGQAPMHLAILPKRPIFSILWAYRAKKLCICHHNPEWLEILCIRLFSILQFDKLLLLCFWVIVKYL